MRLGVTCFLSESAGGHSRWVTRWVGGGRGREVGSLLSYPRTSGGNSSHEVRVGSGRGGGGMCLHSHGTPTRRGTQGSLGAFTHSARAAPGIRWTVPTEKPPTARHAACKRKGPDTDSVINRLGRGVGGGGGSSVSSAAAVAGAAPPAEHRQQSPGPVVEQAPARHGARSSSVPKELRVPLGLGRGWVGAGAGPGPSGAGGAVAAGQGHAG